MIKEINSKKLGIFKIKFDEDDIDIINNSKLYIELDYKGNPVCRDRLSRKHLHTLITQRINMDLQMVKFKNGNKLDLRKQNLIYGKNYKPYNKKKKTNKYEKHLGYYYILINSPKYGFFKVKIDSITYKKVKDFRWYVVKDTNTFYCVSRISQQKRISLHRFILNIDDPYVIVDHINRNGLDCTFKNLRVTTQEINCKNRNISKRNKSGVTGVFKFKNKVYASWFENKKHKYKTFSISKYGEKEAMQMAIELRNMKASSNDYNIID